MPENSLSTPVVGHDWLTQHNANLHRHNAQNLAMIPINSDCLIRCSPPKKNSGISLVEVMVTMVVMTIGLLGLARLQAASLKFNNMASLRTVAIIQSYDLMERMRANKKGLDEGSYHNPTATANADCYTITGCTPQQMARDDFKVWDDLNASLLPAGKGFVCKENSPKTDIDMVKTPADTPACSGSGTRHVVYVTWTEDNKTVTFYQTLEP